MKSKIVVLLLIVIGFPLKGISQVGINTTGTPPDQSAMMDVSASDKGILIPRVSLTSLSNSQAPINNPARGLLVYNLNSPLPEGFYTWAGSSWSALATTDYVSIMANAMMIMAFGEMYEFQNPGSYTSVTLNAGGGWFPWNTGTTGDTNLVSSGFSGGIKQLNIQVGGHYDVVFTSGVQAQSGGLIADAALFRNGVVQNDLRGRTEFRDGSSTQSLTFSGIIELEPDDVIDIRFSGNQNKNLRLETVSLLIRQIN